MAEDDTIEEGVEEASVLPTDALLAEEGAESLSLSRDSEHASW